MNDILRCATALMSKVLVNDVRNVHLLTLVLVHTFDLNVKNRVLVNVNAQCSLESVFEAELGNEQSDSNLSRTTLVVNIVE